MESHMTNALMIVVALLASFMGTAPFSIVAPETGTIRAFVFGKPSMAGQPVVPRSRRSDG